MRCGIRRSRLALCLIAALVWTVLVQLLLISRITDSELQLGRWEHCKSSSWVLAGCS